MMHAQGQAAGARKTFAPMPVTDDEIRERYLDRAIRELNLLAREIQECNACPRGATAPVLGSGHPQADIMLIKYAPRPSEIEEGVAFYGRSGTALMKSLRRLQIDPLAVYGTLFIKCPVPDTTLADPACVARVAEEIAIVGPKIVVLMGEDALDALNELELPLARTLEARVGEVQELAPQMAALLVPNIDVALDEEQTKRDFWSAFRALGSWYADLPPY
jgi:uracil-DNA glycosylase family 4